MDRLLTAIAVAGAATALGLLLIPHGPARPATVAHLVAALDSDGDGRVDPAEYARAADGALPFDALDADGSGALTAWELEVLLTHVSPLIAQKNMLPRAR